MCKDELRSMSNLSDEDFRHQFQYQYTIFFSDYDKPVPAVVFDTEESVIHCHIYRNGSKWEAIMVGSSKYP